MTYSVIINRDKLDHLKESLGIQSNPSFYKFMRERVERHLAEFETVQQVSFSGKRVGSGRTITLELTNTSEIDQIVAAVEGCAE